MLTSKQPPRAFSRGARGPRLRIVQTTWSILRILVCDHLRYSSSTSRKTTEDRSELRPSSWKTQHAINMLFVTDSSSSEAKIIPLPLGVVGSTARECRNGHDSDSLTRLHAGGGLRLFSISHLSYPSSHSVLGPTYVQISRNGTCGKRGCVRRLQYS